MSNENQGRSRRSRSRPQAAPKVEQDTTGNWMHRGNEAKEVSDHEAQEANKRAEQRKQGNAFRYFLPKGEEGAIIILDATFEEIPFFYEHGLKNAEGKWNVFEPCVKEMCECPICQGHGQQGGESRPSYYAMFLSILDTRGFEKRDKTWVDFDRKLMVVKQGQHNEFFRVLEAIQKQHGTIRGAELLMARDGGTANSTAIGKIVPNEEGALFFMNTEDDLFNDFQHDEVKNDSGQVIIEKDSLLQAYDYGKLFPRPDPDALRKKYGAPPTAGSEHANDDGWDETPASSGRGRTRGRGQAPAQEQAPANNRSRRSRSAPAEQQAPEQAPRRSRSRAAPAAEPAAPARRTRGRAGSTIADPGNAFEE